MNVGEVAAWKNRERKCFLGRWSASWEGKGKMGRIDREAMLR